MSNCQTKQIRMTFFQIKSNQRKVEKLISIATNYFEKKEPLLFRLPNQEAVDYLDNLLWRYPKDSFLPHAVTESSSTAIIVLTLSKTANPNFSHSLFNLSVEPVENKDLFFTQIYEFEDLSSTAKNRQAQVHYQLYKKRGYTVITL